MKGTTGRMLSAFACIGPWLLVFLLMGLLCKESKTYLFLCSMILVSLAVFGGSLIPEDFLPDSFRQIAIWLPNRWYTHVMGGVPI